MDPWLGILIVTFLTTKITKHNLVVELAAIHTNVDIFTALAVASVQRFVLVIFITFCADLANEFEKEPV
jgi:hypothetical protein